MLRTLAILAALASAGAFTRAQEDKVVPVHQEPRHRLVFDSPLTKILNIQIPPGDTTLFHTHSDPILYVNMGTSTTRNQPFGGQWNATAEEARAAAAAKPPAPFRPGRMTSTTSYAQKPNTHRVNNVGQSLFWLVGVTNATTGDPDTTPSADFDAKPEIENQWFRGYRWPLPAGSKFEHRHANPVAIVLVSGRLAMSGGASKTFEKPGDFAFLEATTTHQLASVGGDADFVEVEVRRPKGTVPLGK
jgi:quercetin dioxygenase-like cupin family protein